MTALVRLASVHCTGKTAHMNVDPYVLKLDDPKADLARAGGKGTNLARLAQAGFPVPPAFLVTTAAYAEFVAANRLQPFILQTLTGARLDQPDDLQAAATAIRAAFAQGDIPSGDCRSAEAPPTPKWPRRLWLCVLPPPPKTCPICPSPGSRIPIST